MSLNLDSYQKVSCKRIYDKNIPCAKYLSHHVKLGGKHMEHLKDVEKISMDNEHNRIIIISDTKSAGYQAATYLMLKRLSLKETTSSDSRYEEDDELFEDLLEECIEEYDDGDEADTETYTATQDIIVENAELLDPKTEENDSLNPLQMQKRINAVQMVDGAVNVLLQCNRTEQDKEIILEEIADRLELYHNFFLILPSDSVSSNFVERLSFEYDFSIIHAKNPSMSQLQLIFMELTKEYGLKLNKNVDVKEIILDLKSYRGHLFWEKDMEKLIADTAKRLHGKPADQEDFKLFYYNGRKLTGEMQLQGMVGQKEAKAQIMRMTASAKLAEYQREKYEDSMAVYKHMAFSGAPGTGKTQMARVVAQIFHEQGLSNGKFVEAGRNDLVAGYLGQTAIKIAKLFKKAKGGVIFIDEVGSLVQTDKDSYTKEAISALIQYMENNPDTTVIFATYNDEMERFLDSDRGLRSRIARCIEFQAYTEEELWDILKLMAVKQHLVIAEEAKERVMKFIEEYKDVKKDEFGNAREMRKLLQAAQEEIALRFFRSDKKSGQDVITVEDMEKAIEILMERKVVKKAAFGFTFQPDRKDYIAGT